MFCRNCGKELPDNAVACMGCGCDPQKGIKYCHHCGVEVHSNQIVCVKCGSALNVGPVAMGAGGRQAKSKLTYLLLAIFLGEFGIHNFMQAIQTMASFSYLFPWWVDSLPAEPPR